MKRFVTLFVGMFLLGGIFLKAQLPESIPLVTLELKNVPIEDIFQALEKQTGMFFSYESSLLKDLPKVSLSAQDESLSYCLNRLFANLPIIFRITGKYIILKKKPRQYTVSGFVRDSASYESLINATVVEHTSGKGVTSNSYGFFSITLPAGKVVLSSSYIGYQRKEIVIELDRDTLVDIPLPVQKALGEVVVRGRNPHSEVMSSRMGNLNLSSAHLKKLPVLFCEPDLLRALQQEPGIATGTEMFGGMFVRGGNGDDNLYLIDAIPVYNVNHLGGIFSTFNPDAIQHVDFYKGSFPARYGGRLSSVVDVRLKDGNMQHYHGNVSIGLISAKASFEGPIVKDRTSFNLSFRRTWLDALTTPALAVFNRTRDEGEETFAGYSFYDLNAKINHIFSPQSRIYANFYMGQDRLRITNWEKATGIRYGEEYIWRWGNIVTSLNWAYMISPKLFGNFSASYSKYSSKMRDEQRSYERFWGEKEEEILFWKNYNERHFSSIEDAGFRSDFDLSPDPRHRIRFGSDYLYHTYRPEKKWRELLVEYPTGPSKQNVFTSDPIVHAHEWGVYAEDDWLLHDKWKANIGGRFAAYHVEERMYTSFQPRVSLRYLIRNDLSLKASYVKMNQYVHQLSNTYASLPSDIWVPVTAKVKPMNSHQVSAGAYYNLRKMYDFSIEGYYKTMDNLIEYQDNASLFPDYINWDDKISMGSGHSYGVEIMARKNEGRLSGWASYTLSWADRIFNDRMVNEGKRFPSRYDNRHKFNMTLIYKFNDKFDISTSWVYATGNNVTVNVDQYMSPQAGYWRELVLGRNAAKLADYHRLDLSFNYYRPKKKGRMGIWNVSLYNVYNRKNAFYLEYSYDTNNQLKIRQKGLIPILPSASYTYKF